MHPGLSNVRFQSVILTILDKASTVPMAAGIEVTLFQKKASTYCVWGIVSSHEGGHQTVSGDLSPDASRRPGWHFEIFTEYLCSHEIRGSIECERLSKFSLCIIRNKAMFPRDISTVLSTKLLHHAKEHIFIVRECDDG